LLLVSSKPASHEKLHASLTEGASSSPSEQVINPLLGAVSRGHATATIVRTVMLCHYIL